MHLMEQPVMINYEMERQDFRDSGAPLPLMKLMYQSKWERSDINGRF